MRRNKFLPHTGPGCGSGPGLFRAAEAAENLKLTAKDLLALGVIEKIIPESVPGAALRTLKKELSEALARLCALSGEELSAMRYEKFRAIGR